VFERRANVRQASEEWGEAASAATRAAVRSDARRPSQTAAPPMFVYIYIENKKKRSKKQYLKNVFKL
jgi:hypothetical protein